MKTPKTINVRKMVDNASARRLVGMLRDRRSSQFGHRGAKRLKTRQARTAKALADGG